MKPYNLSRFGFTYMLSETPTTIKLLCGRVLLACYNSTTKLTTITDLGLRLHSKVVTDFVGVRSPFELYKRKDIIINEPLVPDDCKVMCTG